MLHWYQREASPSHIHPGRQGARMRILQAACNPELRTSSPRGNDTRLVYSDTLSIHPP